MTFSSSLFMGLFFRSFWKSKEINPMELGRANSKMSQD